MHHFEYRGDELACEGVPLRKIAETVGTPTYVYSYATLERHFKVFDEAFQGRKHIICFSMKANSNLAVLRAMVSWGAGVDIVSGGELYRALKVGADPKKIVFSGVGKREDEIEYAIRSGILAFNVEHLTGLFLLKMVALASMRDWLQQSVPGLLGLRQTHQVIHRCIQGLVGSGAIFIQAHGTPDIARQAVAIRS